MKTSSKLGFVFAGAFGVAAALAGCPGTSPTTTPTPSPTTGPTATPAPARVVMTEVMFYTQGASAGQHQLYLKNIGGMPANLTTYMLAFAPTYPGGQEATASIIDTSTNAAYGSLPAGSTLQIALSGPGVTGAASSSFASGTVQFNNGGGLALFTSPSTTSASMADFVQWGQTGTAFEPVADAAGIWTTDTTIATPSAIPTSGWNLKATTPGATGSANWTFSQF